MSQSDNALREKAIPFESKFLGFDGLQLTTPQNYTPLTRPIRMLQPERGDLIRASLFMQMIAPSDKALNVKIGVGRFLTSAGIPYQTADPTYTPQEISSKHRAITGTNDPFTAVAGGTLTVEADLITQIPKRGDSDFLSDAFVLLVSFDSIPSSLNSYSLIKFRLMASAQMGLT